MVFLYNDVPVPVFDVLTGISAVNSVFQALDRFLPVHKRLNCHAGDFVFALTAVHFADNQFLGNVNHTPCQISGVCRTQSSIGQTLPRSVCRHKVFQNVQPLTEIGLNRQFYRPSRCIRHQPTHTGQLLNLLVGTTGAGIGHHENIIIFIQS